GRAAPRRRAEARARVDDRLRCRRRRPRHGRGAPLDGAEGADQRVGGPRRRARLVLRRAALALAAMTATACSWMAGVWGDVGVVDATDGAKDDGPAGDAAAHDSQAPEDVQSSDAATEAEASREAAVEASDVPDGGMAPDPSTVMCAKTPCTDKQQV